MNVVGQQGVVDGFNPLLLATILPLNLGKAEEEEGCKEQRQMGDISKSVEHWAAQRSCSCSCDYGKI